MEYHRRKLHKKGSKGIDKNWFIDVIDSKTRFMVASEYIRGREKYKLKNLSKKTNQGNKEAKRKSLKKKKLYAQIRFWIIFI